METTEGFRNSHDIMEYYFKQSKLKFKKIKKSNTYYTVTDDFKLYIHPCIPNKKFFQGSDFDENNKIDNSLSNNRHLFIHSHEPLEINSRTIRKALEYAEGKIFGGFVAVDVKVGMNHAEVRKIEKFDYNNRCVCYWHHDKLFHDDYEIEVKQHYKQVLVSIIENSKDCYYSIEKYYPEYLLTRQLHGILLRNHQL